MNDGGLFLGEGFSEYVPSTNATSPPLYSFVIVYSVLSFILVAPLVIWANIYERKQKEALAKAAVYNEEAEFAPYDPTQEEGEDHPQDIVFPIPETNGEADAEAPTSPISSNRQEQSIFREKSKPSVDPLAPRPDTPTAAPTASESTSNSAQQRRRPRGVSGIFRELDRVTQGYPDNDPDFMTVVSGSQANNSRNPRLRTDQSFAHSQAQSQGQNSNAPSAATTSQLYRSQHRPRSQIWDVSARRWKARRPIGRVNVIQRAIQVETESVGASEVGEQRTPLRPMRRSGSSRTTGSRAGARASATASRSGASRGGASRSGASRSVASRGGASRAGASRSGMSRGSRTYASGRSAPSLGSSRQPSSRGSLSETASVRVEQNDGPPLIVSNVPRPSRPPPPVRRHLRGTSVSSFATSGYATTVDDVEPDDAADAHDPGRRNSFDEVQDPELTVCCGAGALWRPRTVCAITDGLIELAEPDPEMRRIVSIGLPLTIGAMSHKFFQSIMVAFISIFIGTESMVAYVLVILLMGFTNELTGAVADAESSLCSYALATGQNFLAGQYLQIALIWHTILSVPVLAIWATQMGPAVTWLVEDEEIGDLARQYTQVIVVLYFIQATSRIFSVLFQLTGNELFETRFMLIEGIVNVVLVSCVISLKDQSQLETVAWIELLVGFAATMVKMFIAICKGWFWPFWPGMSSFSWSTISELRTMIITTIPLILGAFLEYGEWEVLLFFITHLGPAEVATWAILGILWKLLETATEGVGEAASIRVAYHLGNGNPELAKLASYKSLFVAAIQALILTSTLLMSGKNISAWLTNDPTLQNMLNDVITYLGLGNLVMTYAMITWSLVGAQGRYRLATLTILWSRWLVTIPMALVVIFGFRLDVRSVMCCIIVGFATAGLTLAYVLFRSDWTRLSKILQELNALVEDDEDEDDEDESYDDEDDDSSGIDY